MKKKLISSVVLVCLLAFSLLFVSCGGGTSKLAGIWEGEDGSIELLKNGTGNWGGTSVTWTDENNRLMLTSGSQAFSMDYKLSGKTLTLTMDGEAHIFTKK